MKIMIAQENLVLQLFSKIVLKFLKTDRFIEKDIVIDIQLEGFEDIVRIKEIAEAINKNCL